MIRKLLFILLLPGIAIAQTGAARLTSVTPTISTSPYATGDLIGTKLTFSNALQNTKASGYVVSVTVSDKAAQAVDMDLVLFKTDPSNTTFTDNAALDIADADLSSVLGVVNLGSSSRFTFADNSVHHVGSIALPVEGRTSTSGLTGTIYGALISRGTPTFASTSDVTVTIGASRD